MYVNLSTAMEPADVSDLASLAPLNISQGSPKIPQDYEVYGFSQLSPLVPSSILDSENKRMMRE